MHRKRTRSASPRTRPLALLVLLGNFAICLVAGIRAASVPTTGKPDNYPVWWFEREVIKPIVPAANPPPPAWPAYPADYAVPNDFTAVNQGQLKHFAFSAFAEFEAKLPGGAGAELTSMIDGWTEVNGLGQRVPKVNSLTSDFAPVNLGMLKNLAKPFYDRLITEGRANDYPWPDDTSAANDFALANLGQLKHLFRFHLSPDSDGDGLPDWWELAHGLDTLDEDDALLDTDGDGKSNHEEYEAGTDPNDYYNGHRPPGIPAAPSAVREVRNADGSRTIYWESNSNNETYFVIRDHYPDGSTVELGRVGPGQTRLHIPAPTP